MASKCIICNAGMKNSYSNICMACMDNFRGYPAKKLPAVTKKDAVEERKTAVEEKKAKKEEIVEKPTEEVEKEKGDDAVEKDNDEEKGDDEEKSQNTRGIHDTHRKAWRKN